MAAQAGEYTNAIDDPELALLGPALRDIAASPEPAQQGRLRDLADRITGRLT